MTLTYFCDVDIHLKENFRNQDLGACFFRNTPCLWNIPCPRAPAVAFRSTANLSIASYSRRAKGVPLLQTIFFVRLDHFRDIGVQRSPMILGAFRKFAIFRLALQRRLVKYSLDFIFGRLVGLVEALHRNNFG